MSLEEVATISCTTTSTMASSNGAIPAQPRTSAVIKTDNPFTNRTAQRVPEADFEQSSSSSDEEEDEKKEDSNDEVEDKPVKNVEPPKEPMKKLKRVSFEPKTEEIPSKKPTPERKLPAKAKRAVKTEDKTWSFGDGNDYQEAPFELREFKSILAASIPKTMVRLTDKVDMMYLFYDATINLKSERELDNYNLSMPIPGRSRKPWHSLQKNNTVVLSEEQGSMLFHAVNETPYATKPYNGFMYIHSHQTGNVFDSQLVTSQTSCPLIIVCLKHTISFQPSGSKEAVAIDNSEEKIIVMKPGTSFLIQSVCSTFGIFFHAEDKERRERAPTTAGTMDAKTMKALVDSVTRLGDVVSKLNATMDTQVHHFETYFAKKVCFSLLF
jgi:hypothetical protein